ncbi:hypothetical protein FACS1894201_07260 [Bacteroidia bacterium]|nr:hypothetical protein FACS1894201_07260 [Bacteroidia bacterium]
MIDFQRIDVTPDTFCHVADVPSDDVLIEQLRTKLPPEEQATSLRYRHESTRRMFVTARTLLREELSKSGIPYDTPMAFGEYGKPYLRYYLDFHFSIAHSYGRVVVAFSNAPVGVDIERLVCKPKSTLIAIAQKVFRSDEIAMLQILEEPACRQRFTELWTIKEALVKTTGAGLGRPVVQQLQSYSYSMDNWMIAVGEPNSQFSTLNRCNISSSANIAILVNANHFLPKSFNDAPI